MRLSLLALAAKYRLEIIQYSPGHIAVRIRNWHLIEPKIATMLSLVENDPYIYAIYVDEDVIEVLYDQDAIQKEDILKKWFSMIQELNL